MPLSEKELRARKTLASHKLTDFDRWRDLANFQESWNARAEYAAKWIHTGDTVLDVGCGAMALERFLPPGCTYIPSDLFPRDARTVVCNLNRDPLPLIPGVTVITALGLLEYLTDLPTFFGQVSDTGARFIASYHAVGEGVTDDREGAGWINAYTLTEWMDMSQAAGLYLVALAGDASQYLAMFQAKPTFKTILQSAT